MARLPGGGGRKRTQLKRIEIERERAISFTKRHVGLLKKANELATLCGIEISINLFSLSGKPLAFGTPNVPYIINKFLNSNQVNKHPDDFVTRFDKSSNESKVYELCQELDEVNEQLANEKKKGQMLQERLKASLGWESYEQYVESLGINGFKELKCKLNEMNRHIVGNEDELSGPSCWNLKVEGSNQY